MPARTSLFHLWTSRVLPDAHAPTNMTYDMLATDLGRWTRTVHFVLSWTNRISVAEVPL